MMFSSNSRYAKAATYAVKKIDGTVVTATRLPLPAPRRILGFHQRHQGQRLDLIASHYLNDATAFWQLCDSNNAMVPDSLGVHDLVGIPVKA
jgi:hypothetical protein